MKTYICEECGLIEETRILQKTETLPVRGEDITFTAPARVCADCGQSVFDEELDNQSLLQAYEIYRQRHDIISPEEIKDLRLAYGLTQRGLSNLLGLGEISIHRYENGSLPDEAHNQLLRFIQDPWNMQRLFDKNRSRLTSASQRKIEERVLAIINAETADKLDEIIAAQHKQPTILTGFKSFESDVLMEMMVFFAKEKGVFKTKMNKLLWYADFLHFDRCSISISGATYCHLPHGPVADKYEFYVSRLLSDGSLTYREEDFGDYTAEKLIAKRESENTLFPMEALATLDAVFEYFKNFTSTQIRNLSHEEPAYKETEELEEISYEYAKTLQVRIPVDMA